MAKVKWLSRSLLLGPYLTVVTSEAQYKQVFKHLKSDLSYHWLNDTGRAAVTTLTNSRHGLTCIVSVDLSQFKDRDDLWGAMAHEAVHVFRAWKKHVGELDPSEEFEAYCIQHLTQKFMEALPRRWKK